MHFRQIKGTEPLSGRNSHNFERHSNQWEKLKQKLHGHLAYYGITDNAEALERFHCCFVVFLGLHLYCWLPAKP
jgi:hypothetical protein